MATSAQYQASLERVLTRLEQANGRGAKFEGGQWKALCPAHPDRTPSLTVKWSNGATMVHCHAGCTGTRPHVDPTPVLAALGLTKADLFDEPMTDREGYRGVTNLTDKRRQRARVAKPAPEKYEVAPELAPRIIPKAKPKPGEKVQVEGDGEPYAAAWHLYQDPDTLDVIWAAIRIVQPLKGGGYDKAFVYVHRDETVTSRTAKGKRICLGESPTTGKKRFETLPDGWVTKMPTEARLQTLFYLGAVRDDVANGKTIYVVEGESDTAAGRAAGMATTTAPKGNGKWQPHHSIELIGADVVIVADCDDAGIQGAETTARSLVGKAASIRVVQAREGKDLRDHLAAGHGPDDLVEIDLGIPELHPERATPANTDNPAPADRSSTWNTSNDYSDAPNGDYVDDPDAPNEKPRYLIRKGEIVERTWKAMGRGEDVVYYSRYKTILKCAAWVTEVTEADDGSEDNGRNLVKETRDSVLHLERFSPGGELVDQMDLRFPQEMLDRGEWVRNWPWPDTFVGHKKADKEKALSGIYAAHDAPTRRTKVYVATGWRETETGPIFVHGSGAIGRGGTVDVDVDLDMILSRTALPDPTEDAAALRAAYWNGTDPLRQLPAKIAAPLRGQLFASLIAPMAMVTHLHGPRGTKKTALARVHLQHMAPGMNFHDDVKEMVSGASGISSPKGMARMLGRAKDIVLLVDDLAPDRGGAAEARVRLAELARQVYNRSAGTKATFNPREVVNELPPRCSLLTTGEITADGSAGTRCLNIAVELGVVSDELITDLESRKRVEARGILGASFLMWAAQRREELMVWREELREQFLVAWRKSLADLPYGSDILSRVAEAARDYTLGELFLLSFLLDRRAITEDEADEMWEWSVKGILDAATAIEAETSDVAAGLIWTIKELIATGRVHLTDRSGDSPVVDGDRYAPQRWGYTAQQRPGAMGQSEVLWRENGTRIGAVDDKNVFLIPAEVEYQARQHRQRAERAWTETTSSLAAALDTRGWLTTHTDKRTGKKHRSVGRELYGGRTMRVWHLRRELFDGPEDGGPNDGAKPTPVDFRLQRRPSWLEIPLEESAEQQREAELPAAVGYAGQTAPLAARPASARTETAPPLQPVQAPAPAEPAVGDVTPAAPAAAPTSPAPTLRLPKPATPGAPQGATMTEPDWTHRLAVFDLDAVYLPERDGQVTVLPLAEPPSAADLAEYAADFDLHRGTTSVGQVYVSPRLSDALGLVVDEDLTAMVEKLGLNDPAVRPDLKDKKSRRNVAALEQLAERGQQFVAELRAAGWQVDTLRPRFTIRRPDPDEPENSRKTRVFGIVLDAFSYMWEAKEDDMSGPDQRKYPLPDPDDHPADYCSQLAARLGRIGELLGVSWQASAAATGGELVERGAVRMPKPKGGEREVDWRRQGKEIVPQDAIRASNVRGQMMWEPHNKWSRTPGEDELAAATELWVFDERGSYLPRAGSLQFGYGEPEQIDPAQLLDLLRAGKQPYGLSLLDLPKWDVASFMPPHPDMAEKQVNRRWTTLRTPWLLANAHKHSAYDFAEDLDDAVQEVWFWPKTHRIYGEWAERVRNARMHAGEKAEFAAAMAANAKGPGERALWTVEAENWFAVEAMTKNVYSGYFGRLASPRIIAKESAQRYHYHYRPIGQQTVWGEQRVQAWIKLAKYEARTGLAPLFASGTDSYGFLAPGLGGVIPEPDVDDGRFGKLRVKHRVLLTDAMRERLLQGAPGYQVFDVELARLAKAGEAA